MSVQTGQQFLTNTRKCNCQPNEYCNEAMGVCDPCSAICQPFTPDCHKFPNCKAIYPNPATTSNPMQFQTTCKHCELYEYCNEAMDVCDPCTAICDPMTWECYEHDSCKAIYSTTPTPPHPGTLFSKNTIIANSTTTRPPSSITKKNYVWKILFIVENCLLLVCLTSVVIWTAKCHSQKCRPRHGRHPLNCLCCWLKQHCFRRQYQEPVQVEDNNEHYQAEQPINV